MKNAQDTTSAYEKQSKVGVVSVSQGYIDDWPQPQEIRIPRYKQVTPQVFVFKLANNYFDRS